jgi:excinuclease UvrABC nuclease subunit
MIDPSTLDLKTLPWLPLEERTVFPTTPAIYFCLNSTDDILYIGRSQNVRTRWSRHHQYGALSVIANIKVAYLFVDQPELLPELERSLIKFYNPPLNSLLRNQTVQELRVKDFFKTWAIANNELQNATRYNTELLYY